MYPILAAYFNSRFRGKFFKHQKRQYSKLQHTTPGSIALFIIVRKAYRKAESTA